VSPGCGVGGSEQFITEGVCEGTGSEAGGGEDGGAVGEPVSLLG
jgi:hypothetical protein